MTDATGGTPRTCNVVHEGTDAVCELESGHSQNHRGQFDNGIAQWPDPGWTPPATPLSIDEEAQHSPLMRAAYVSALLQINALRTEVAQMTQEQDTAKTQTTYWHAQAEAWQRQSNSNMALMYKVEARLSAQSAALDEITRDARGWAAVDGDREFLRGSLRIVADRIAALQTPEGT